MSTISGKALLVIERLDSKWVKFRVHPFIQSCSGGDDGRDCVQGDFSCCDTDSLPLPNAAYKMQPGDVIRVAVTYEFTYTCDYWGEWDVDLTYRKQRVLRRQPARKCK